MRREVAKFLYDSKAVLSDDVWSQHKIGLIDCQSCVGECGIDDAPVVRVNDWPYCSVYKYACGSGSYTEECPE